MNSRRLLPLAAVLALLAASPASPAAAQPAADFYRGRQVTMIIGSSSGGGYDTQGRLVARHLGRKILGNPTIVVQNMPGAGSIPATNHLYNVVPRDGSVFALLQREMLIASLISPQNVRFDISKFNWIGSISSETGIVVAWHSSPLQTAADLFKTEMVIGGTGPMNDTETTPRLLNALIGTKFKIVSGYPGTTEVLLAMERGEVMGLGDWSWSNIKASKMDMLQEGKIRLLMQGALEKSADLPNVPFMLDYAKTPEDRRLIEFLLAPKAVARPLAVPPGVPADRVTALRDAFMALKTDPEFIRDVEKTKLDVSLTPGAEVGRIIQFIGSVPKAETDRVMSLISPVK
jgi:tripartite-type tricarboxylate transporter receptor subunit TctC